jgi:Golgi phosphoprotein 3 (GPP34)
MDTLGEDLFLLSFRPGKGRLWPAVGVRLNFGLAGSELIRLAAAGWITVDGDQVTVASQHPADDPNLAAALASLVAAGQPVSATRWIFRTRPGIRRAYLDPLVAAGTLSEKPARMFGPKFFVTDEARLARVRGILDAVVHSSGQVDATSAAYAGMCYAIDLNIPFYPAMTDGLRLKAAATGPVQAADSALPAQPADGEPGAAGDAALRVAIATVTEAAISASLRVSSTGSSTSTALLQETMPNF